MLKHYPPNKGEENKPRDTVKTLKQIRTYPVPINDQRIKELITWYTKTLQKTIDIIWNNITWQLKPPKLIEKKGTLYVQTKHKLHTPTIPKDKTFKKKLRDELMKDNPYANHWIDAVIRNAYTIIKNWRKRYLKGMAKKAKPKIKRRFARCKITLMKIDYEKKIVRITLKPHEHIKASWRGAWFERRIDGWQVGEVILKDDKILIPFKHYKLIKIMDIIGWDSNELELTGYTPKIGFIHLNLKPLQSIKIVYETKKAITQKHNKKDLYEKYAKRERNREKDFLNKLGSQLINTFPNTIHDFEDLEKNNMTSRKKVEKVRRKRNARTPWKRIHGKVCEKALVVWVDPRNTSKTCSRCGFVNEDLRGQDFVCPRCGFRMNRQKNAARNIWKRYVGKHREEFSMWGFSHSDEPEDSMRVELWVGVTLNGRRLMIWWGDGMPRLRPVRSSRVSWGLI
jgi:putative transposase